jgi:hypothetical protein
MERKGILVSRSQDEGQRSYWHESFTRHTFVPSSHQISSKNLHSFRRYGAEWNFGFKVRGSRWKVASTRIFRRTHLCPRIHPLTKYKPKIFIRLRDTEQKVIYHPTHDLRKSPYCSQTLCWLYFSSPWWISPPFQDRSFLRHKFPNFSRPWQANLIFPTFSRCPDPVGTRRLDTNLSRDTPWWP